MDLDSAARDLYALTPAEFTARRDALTREARDAGDRDLAKQVNGLRKPALAAWLVNQLVISGPAELGELLDVGTQLRDAHAELAGRRMQDLSKRRQQLVQVLTRAAEQLASDRGQPATPAALRQVTETLGAAVADPAAAAAVSSGRLTRPLVYAGLGEVDVSEATATPLSVVREPRAAASGTNRAKKAGTPPDRLQELRAAAQSAVDDAAAAARQLEDATASREELTERVEQLQQSLSESRYDLAAARSAAERAERGLRQAERRARAADRALQDAEGSGSTS